MASKVVVTEFKVTWGTGGAATTYDAKSIPCDVPQSCEPVEVTVGTDIETRYAAAGITSDDPIEVVLAGTPPSEGDKKNLALAMKTSTAGAAAVAATVDCGPCIVTGVKPTTIEAGGERAQWWTVTFQPDGTRT